MTMNLTWMTRPLHPIGLNLVVVSEGGNSFTSEKDRGGHRIPTSLVV